MIMLFFFISRIIALMVWCIISSVCSLLLISFAGISIAGISIITYQDVFTGSSHPDNRGLAVHTTNTNMLDDDASLLPSFEAQQCS